MTGDALVEGAETFFVDLSIVTPTASSATVAVWAPSSTMTPHHRCAAGHRGRAVGRRGQRLEGVRVHGRADGRPGRVVERGFRHRGRHLARRGDNDYTPVTGTLTFGIGEGSKTITVQVTGDTNGEANEVFYVDLTNAIKQQSPMHAARAPLSMTTSGAAPPAGLVSWWTADDTASDLMQRNNATLASGTTYAQGVVGQAFSFDGVDDRVQLPDSESLKLTESLSIEGWIYVNALTSSTNFETILFRGDSRGGLDPYDLHVNPNGDLHFGISSLTAAAAVETPIPIGRFIHVAATLDDATGAMKLYVDGALATQTITSVRPFGDLDPTMNPGIGIGSANSTYNVPFDGLIDELSASQSGPYGRRGAGHLRRGKRRQDPHDSRQDHSGHGQRGVCAPPASSPSISRFLWTRLRCRPAICG